MRHALDTEFARWYPTCVDTAFGCHFSDLNADWELEGPQRKMIVTQARHVWSTSNAAMFYPEKRALPDAAAHGVRWLRTTMWDPEMGEYYGSGFPVLLMVPRFRCPAPRAILRPHVQRAMATTPVLHR
jgi:mannobiose 2-epimerase